MPVLPLVASRTTLSGVSRPERSPSRIIASAARSLTDPPGLRCSAFAYTSTPGGSPSARRPRRSSGVPPTHSSSPVGSLFNFSPAADDVRQTGPRTSQLALRQVPVRDLVLRLEVVLHLLRRVVDGLRRGADDLVALLPVGGRGARVLVGGLQGVEGAQHFVNVAAETHRVVDERAHLLLGVDDEDGADGRRLGRAGVDEPVLLRDLGVEVRDDGEVYLDAEVALDVPYPSDVRRDGIDGEADELRAAPLELFGAARELDELGRADRREVGRVREEHDPLALVVRQQIGRASCRE